MINLLRCTLFIFILNITTVAQANLLNQKAPDFSLPDRTQQTVSLHKQLGKVVFINFWASWCPPCRIEFPELIKLAGEHDKSKFVVLAINVDKDPKSIEVFLKNFPNLPENFTVLSDPDFISIKKYNAVGMPSSFIVGPDGTVKHLQAGYNKNDPQKWRLLINEISQ